MIQQFSTWAHHRNTALTNRSASATCGESSSPVQSSAFPVAKIHPKCFTPVKTYVTLTELSVLSTFVPCTDLGKCGREKMSHFPKFSDTDANYRVQSCKNVTGCIRIMEKPCKWEESFSFKSLLLTRFEEEMIISHDGPGSFPPKSLILNLPLQSQSFHI